MSDVQGDAPARSQYVEFWNSVLVLLSQKAAAD
jgi:hypothetical protein